MGTRNKIVQYFKKELENDGNVIATDCSNKAPAIYEADKQHLHHQLLGMNFSQTVTVLIRQR